MISSDKACARASSQKRKRWHLPDFLTDYHVGRAQLRLAWAPGKSGKTKSNPIQSRIYNFFGSIDPCAVPRQIDDTSRPCVCLRQQQPGRAKRWCSIRPSNSPLTRRAAAGQCQAYTSRVRARARALCRRRPDREWTSRHSHGKWVGRSNCAAWACRIVVEAGGRRFSSAYIAGSYKHAPILHRLFFFSSSPSSSEAVQC